MSIHNPFPPRGEAHPVDVFIWFWIPVIIIGLPIIWLLLSGIFTLVSILLGW